MDEVGRPDILLRNDGNSFVNVSKEAGIMKEVMVFLRLGGTTTMTV